MKKALVALAALATWTLAGSGGAAAAVSCAPGSAPAPSVVTDFETNVTVTGATLHGKVDPHGCPTTYHFEYGTTTAYGSVTPQTSAGSGTTSVAASATIGGLAPHTVYHFRIVASSPGGTTDGSDIAFRTKLACTPGGGARPPAVVTDHATAVLTTSAELRGKVDPHGCPTTYHFEYGTTTAYGHVTPTADAGSGTHSFLAMAAISGLAPDTFYHFRIVATSGAGTTTGADIRLKTLKSASLVEIASHRASVRRGFVARIRLRCVGGNLPCQGTVTIRYRHHRIGHQRYVLSADSAGVVSVHLNRRGRTAMRSHRKLRTKVSVTSTSNTDRAFVRLIRRFRPH
ncbi:MAG TPA: fibronectin type III domain-containing protein [Solirubrobacteraceae bacterium]|nr:fibronectin type III domain-containing protein [Solirubrobacteraceae bacterium]